MINEIQVHEISYHVVILSCDYRYLMLWKWNVEPDKKTIDREIMVPKCK